MSLLKPTPGQIWDRITILKLKIDAFKVVRRGYAELAQELLELESYLRGMARSKEADNLTVLLGATNEHLWTKEDELRRLMAEPPALDYYEIADVAVQIAKLNDQRCDLIRKIDAEYGMKQSIEEKIYTGH